MIQGKAVDTTKFNAKENNGTIDVTTQVIPVVPVTLDGSIADTKSIVASVIADGFYTAAEICTADYATACTAAGIK